MNSHHQTGTHHKLDFYESLSILNTFRIPRRVFRFEPKWLELGDCSDAYNKACIYI